jgi:hypothetical protein
MCIMNTEIKRIGDSRIFWARITEFGVVVGKIWGFEASQAILWTFLGLGTTTTVTMTKELLVTLKRIWRRFPMEIPLRSRHPSQSRCLRRFHRRRSHTRWSSPRLVRRSYPRPPQRQHRSGFPTSMCSWSRTSPRIPSEVGVIRFFTDRVGAAP